MGGAVNPELDKLVQLELNDNDNKNGDQGKTKVPWHRKLNRVVDKVLTHPIVEAGKTAARFVPGVGIFMIGVDRLTRWKLTYTNNAALVSRLEKKMTDITITYISLIELLPPKERCQDNPRLRIFSKRAEQVKRLVALIQRSITEFEQKNEKERLAMAEVIQSSFKSLQSILDELQRDIELHLGIQTTAGIQAHGKKLDSIIDVLKAQRSVLESQADRNNKLLSLVQRQIQASDHIQSVIAQLKDDLTPGYAKVDNLEIRRVWWDFFRWPAALPTKDFLIQMPQYFRMQNDTIALTIWTQRLQQGTLLSVNDFDLDLNGVVTPMDLNLAFPADPIYEITLGDWLVWRALGWVYLCSEILRSMEPLRKKFIQSTTVVSHYIEFVSLTLQKLRTEHGYDATVHARLLDISIRAISSARPPFASRFQCIVDVLADGHEVLQSTYTQSNRSWLDASVQEALAQSLATMQWRLVAECQELSIPDVANIWTSDELAEWMATDAVVTQRVWEVGTTFANTIWNHWNGSSALISPHAFALDRIHKLGPRTFVTQLHHVQPVVLKRLLIDEDSVDTVNNAVEAAARAAAQWNICRGLVTTHGITFVTNTWMMVVEYCQRGNLRSIVCGNDNGTNDISLLDNDIRKIPSRVSLLTKLKLMGEIAAAVRFMHACGVAHRYLTTAHIYITDSYSAKVGGFVSGSVDADIIRYRAPETLDWNKDETHHDVMDDINEWQGNDVYALGHIMLEMIRGKPPHHQVPDTDMQGILDAILKFDPNDIVMNSLPNGFPQDLVDLVLSALAIDSRERCTLKDFCSTLESIYSRQRQTSSSVSVEDKPNVRNGMTLMSDVIGDDPPSYYHSIAMNRNKDIDTTVVEGVEPNTTKSPPSLSLAEINAVGKRMFDPTEDMLAIERDLRQLVTHHPRAYFYLGDMYYYDNTDRGIPHNFQNAFECYSMALERGDALAAVGVGDCYYFGIGYTTSTGGNKQPGLARDLYLRALPVINDTTTLLSPCTIARIHAGLGDVTYDSGEYQLALDHYYRAVNVDDRCTRAWARIGDAHLYGRGISVDLDHARKCYRKAKGSRREVEGMIEFYRVRGEYAFANMYINDPILASPDY